MTGPSNHEHYEHYDASMSQRLDGAWGRVDMAINRDIATLLRRGERVLDIGCGFGSLTRRLAQTHRVVGIDPLLFCLDVAARRHQGTTVVCGSACELPVADEAMDVAVFRDVLHHLVEEAPIDKVFGELERAGVRRVIVVDPNPSFILRWARRLIGHRDPVCTPAQAASYLAAGGFRVERTSYGILWSIALSGGYVGPVLMPPWRALWVPLLWLERVLCRLLCRVGLGRFLCWRYSMVATRPPGH